MENKKYENRIVYAALVLVLTVLAALVVVTGIVSRRADPTPDVTDSGTEKVVESNKNHGTAEHDPNGDRPTMADPGPDDTKKNETDNVVNGDTDETKDPSSSVDAPSELPQFIAPTEGAVSKAHSETVLVYSMTMNDYRTHTGVDITSLEGSEVKAAADGVVAEVWDDPLWGCCVSLSHEGDAVSVYKNLTRESYETLTVGEVIEAGEVIGSVGDTALCELADESHLHFELKIGGVSVDPEDYIEFAVEDVFAE